ncbi:MAG: glycosyltransferase family 1 protein [Acidimicrobiia bacterium]
MRVAVNVEQLLQPAPGGIGRYTAQLVKLLPTRDPGVDVSVFMARHPRRVVDAALDACGLCDVDAVVLPLPRPLLYDTWHVLGRGGPARRVAPVDLVHAPSPAVPPLEGVPLVVTVHDAAPITMPEATTRRGRRFHTRGFAAAARRARLVIAVSEFAADEIAANTPIPRERMRIVPNGVNLERATAEDVERVTRSYGIADRPYVFWIGTFQPRKNLRVLLDAFARLDETDVPHRLVLAGEGGWVSDDSAAIRRLGDRVRALGAVGEADAAALYAGADLFVFPSRHEGFGIPVLEAMAQGTPVVCSDIPALREVGGDSARFVSVDDVDALADAISSLLRDAAARAALVDRGLEHARGYSWERCADATIAVYHEALG